MLFHLGHNLRIGELVRRLFHDAFGANDNRSQGLYADGVRGLLLEENLFDHNGWNASAGGGQSPQNHNAYLSEGNNNVVVRGNVFANASANSRIIVRPYGEDGVRVTVAAVPGKPTEVRAVPGNGSIIASWKAPTNPGTAIDGYGMFVFDEAGAYTEKYAWACATCTTATVPGLVNGRTYYAAVYAHNPNGWGTLATSAMVVAGTPVLGCVALSVNGPAGIAIELPHSLNDASSWKSPFPSLHIVRGRANSGFWLWNVTFVLATAVTPSLPTVRPRTVPASDGSGSSALVPVGDTAKLRIDAISASLKPDSASGGSCTRRSAAARAAFGEVC